jgi:hypothetical protein
MGRPLLESRGESERKDQAGRRILHHGSTIEGGRAMLLMFPDAGIVVTMLSDILADFGEQEAQRFGSFFNTN